MTARDLRLLDALEAHRAEVTARLDALPGPLVHRAPAPGAWSLAQLAEHFELIDRGLRLDGPPASPLVRATSRLRSGGIRAILALPLRIEGPPSARPVMPTAAPRWAEVRERWPEARAGWRSASTAPDAVAYTHPIAGPFVLDDALAFLVAHHRHHDAQIRRTLRALGVEDQPARPHGGRPVDILRPCPATTPPASPATSRPRPAASASTASA